MAVIDRERGYIFFHVAKTAGMSIANTLVGQGGRRITDDPDLVGAIREHWPASEWAGGKGRIEHVRPVVLREVFGAEAFDAMERVAVIRNPWDRLRSVYRYQRQRPPERVRSSMRAIIDLPLSDFAAALCRADYPTIVRLLGAGDGSLLVNTLLRFENLENDFGSWSERMFGKPVALPRINQSRRDGKERFNEGAITAIREHFAEDFEQFGYSDSPPD